MSEQEKKWQWIYDLFNTETKPKKISEMIVVVYDLHQVQAPFIMLYGGVIENKTNVTSHSNIGLL